MKRDVILLPPFLFQIYLHETSSTSIATKSTCLMKLFLDLARKLESEATYLARESSPPSARVREWSTGMSPDQTYRLIEQPFWTMKRNKFNEADGACRAGPVLGKADVARNYRRGAVFKKQGGEKRERGKREGRDVGSETILSNGRCQSHGLSTLYTRWRCRNRLARSAKIIRSSSVKCNKRGANVQKGREREEGNCNIKFVRAWNAWRSVYSMLKRCTISFKYLIIRGGGEKNIEELMREEEEEEEDWLLEKISFFSQFERDNPPSVRNERPIIRGERERENKKNYKEGSIVLALVAFVWRGNPACNVTNSRELTERQDVGATDQFSKGLSCQLARSNFKRHSKYRRQARV